MFNGITWTNTSGSVALGNIATSTVPTSNGGALVFMAHNLGADTSADPLVPSWKLNGAYFQWGIKPVDTNGDMYKSKPNSGNEGFAAAPSGPGASEANVTSVVDWSTTLADDGAWNVSEVSPVKTANDPCPIGYRVPTRNEWMSIFIDQNGNEINIPNAPGSTWSQGFGYDSGKIVNNSMYLPAAGLVFNTGVAHALNAFGMYWCSTEYNVRGSYNVYFYSAGVMENWDERNLGLSVRCVKE